MNDTVDWYTEYRKSQDNLSALEASFDGLAGLEWNPVINKWELYLVDEYGKWRTPKRNEKAKVTLLGSYDKLSESINAQKIILAGLHADRKEDINESLKGLKGLKWNSMTCKWDAFLIKESGRWRRPSGGEMDNRDILNNCEFVGSYDDIFQAIGDMQKYIGSNRKEDLSNDDAQYMYRNIHDLARRVEAVERIVKEFKEKDDAADGVVYWDK